MAKNNIDTVAKVRAQIDKYISDNEREIGEIDQHIASARTDKEKAEAALKAAIETTNQDDFARAKAQIAAADNAIEMFTARREQLANKEFLSESESDAVIDSLLEYKDARDKEFIDAIDAQIATLDSLVSGYNSAYKEMVSVIRDWEHRIHCNYRNPIVTYPAGVAPQRKPVPVSIPNKCTAANITAEYLNRIKNAIS